MTDLWFCSKCKTTREPILERGKPKIRSMRNGFVAVFLVCGHVARVDKDRIPEVNQQNLLDYIVKFEGGDEDLTLIETLAFFSYLIRSGMAWTLQGMYGRYAMNLINAGFLDKSGSILKVG